MLKAEILNRKLKEYEQQKKWAQAMINFSISSPKLVAACGAKSVFGGDFDKVALSPHDVKFGSKIHGSKYSEIQEVQNYTFKYMDFQTNSIVTSSMASEMTPINVWPFDIMVDSHNKKVITDVYSRYILTKIVYNEQMYRSKLANAISIRAKERTKILRFAWTRARSLKLTNEVLLISNNNRNRR